MPRRISFDCVDIRDTAGKREWDVLYARFLLTHLSDPAGAVSAFCDYIQPGGLIAIEDIDFSGYFTYPASKAFDRYRELYCAIVTKRGGDSNIGPRLPLLLKQCGFQDGGVSVVQPGGTEGEVKLISPLTMENIIGPILEDGLAQREEIDTVVRELYEFARNPHTVASTPRIVQVWAGRPKDPSGPAKAGSHFASSVVKCV